jgi:hypothetical protein
MDFQEAIVEYYALWYRLDSQDRYLVWVEGEDSSKDTVMLDRNGYLLVFDLPDRVLDYAEKNNLSISVENLSVHDLDRIESWIGNISSPLDCVNILSAWNLFSDVSHSVERYQERFVLLDRTHHEIYNKIFFGNNLPSITPEGETYVPEWSLAELDIVCDLMSSGITMFRGNLRGSDRS